MRIIIVADNASSRFGGEAFIPFNYFRLLRARNIDVRLVVHARNKSELLSRFPDDPERLFFVEDTWLHKTLFRFGQYLPRRLADATTGLLIHLSTQLSQRRILGALIKAHDINVVHQPIPVSPKTPSQIWGLGVPVLIGPLNGGMEYPPAFRGEQGKSSRFALLLGRALANLSNLLMPGKRLARFILVANRRTQDALPIGIGGQIVEVVDNGVDFNIWQKASSERTHNACIRFVFIGRLIDWKAVEIILEALHRLQGHISASLEIIGEGPMRQSWEAATDQLDLKTVVTFSGFLSQQDCAERLKHADVMVLPSLFECGGAVVLEAMAVGLPVIATAWGGPLDYLDQTCGILVAPDSREALIAGFAGGMKTLAQSQELRTKLGEAGYARARQYFDWESKIDKILELYQLAQQPAERRTKRSTPLVRP
jgi:glycosyltransferase involved in cell wall biosynthesis